MLIKLTEQEYAKVKVLSAYFEGHIAKHLMNINVMMNNPMAIHDHTDYTGAIEKELEIVADYEDKLAVLNKYFKQENV